MLLLDQHIKKTISPSINNNNNTVGLVDKQKIMDTINEITDDISCCRTLEQSLSSIIPQENEQETGHENMRPPEVTVFISKMIPVKISELSTRDRLRCFPTPESQGNATEVLMGIGRVFSGVLTSDTTLYILSHRHNPFDGFNTQVPATVVPVPKDSLGFYICLGPSVFPTDTVSAGNIVGIIGLQQGNAEGTSTNLMMSKCATLTSNYNMFPMKTLTFQSKPMVRVAVGPKTHHEMVQFEYGLQQLYSYDPVVEIDVDSSTGQHTITCLGELHLEQCIKQLSERFAK